MNRLLLSMLLASPAVFANQYISISDTALNINYPGNSGYKYKLIITNSSGKDVSVKESSISNIYISDLEPESNYTVKLYTCTKENKCSLLITEEVLTKKQIDTAFFANHDLSQKTSGNIIGGVKFAQTHTIDPIPKNNGLKLVSQRDTLFIFKPESKEYVNLTIKVFDSNNNNIYSSLLNSPLDFPKSDKPNNITTKNVEYISEGWSTIIPGCYIKPGIRIEINDEFNNKGYLDSIIIGAENKVLLNTINIGMLTPPDVMNKIQQDDSLANDYFNKIPISELIVNNYNPIYLDKIVLPDGKTYIDNSEVNGGVYSGDMREDIAKGLISMGIDNANFGINASKGKQQWQPQLFNQYTIHRAIGKYQNGIVRHGLSGGNGMATLTETIGNEFSHELGHNYGLGHYPGGVESVHQEHKPWGWDIRHNRFIANFHWNHSNDVNISGVTILPYLGLYGFNSDAMAGGSASSALSKYTLHTEYSAAKIQKTFEQTGIISKNSSTGYMKWNPSTMQMEEFHNEYTKKPSQEGVPITTILGFYDPQQQLTSYIYPALYGSYGFVYDDIPQGGQCWADVSTKNGLHLRYGLPSQRLEKSYMNKFHFNIPTNINANNVDIYCPDITKYADKLNYDIWVKSYFNVDKFHSWDNSRRGNIGDIYIGHINGDNGKYYRLKKNTYWYFPDGTNSNQNWEYLGSINEIKKIHKNKLAEKTYNSYGKIRVASRVLNYNNQEPLETMIVNNNSRYLTRNTKKYKISVGDSDNVLTVTNGLVSIEQNNKQLNQIWTLDSVGDFYIIKNESENCSINIESNNGNLECSSIPRSYWSSHWLASYTNDLSLKNINLFNRWKKGYLDGEHGDFIKFREDSLNSSMLELHLSPVKEDIESYPNIMTGMLNDINIKITNENNSFTSDYYSQSDKQNIYMLIKSPTTSGAYSEIIDGEIGSTVLTSYSVSTNSPIPVVLKLRASLESNGLNYQINDSGAIKHNIRLKISFNKEDNINVPSGKYIINFIINIKDKNDPNYDVYQKVAISINI